MGVSKEIIFSFGSSYERADSGGPQVCRRGSPDPTGARSEARASAQGSAAIGIWCHLPNAWTPTPPLSQAAGNSKLNGIKAGLTWPREHLRLQASSPKLESPCLGLSEPAGRGRNDYYLTLLRNNKKKKVRSGDEAVTGSLRASARSLTNSLFSRKLLLDGPRRASAARSPSRGEPPAPARPFPPLYTQTSDRSSNTWPRSRCLSHTSSRGSEAVGVCGAPSHAPKLTRRAARLQVRASLGPKRPQ